ncbi:hypothetical protein [Brevibacterium sp. S111]|uniref:hypothetical protein n=1 Tax=unclassified Brevibacterium TaxID=2614124 RepID=UPI001081FCAF|nr:hypothetical protein [Brevibacterium sp. S111]TGD13625.1 hypothetical protein EB836_01090 [Brevibacterium sp. S111]
MVDADIPAGASTSRRTFKDELFGPPRHNSAAKFSVVAFGLVLVASLVAPSLSWAEAMPGTSLTTAGLMVLCGFAELIDAHHRRLVVALRFAGLSAALLGLLLQLL